MPTAGLYGSRKVATEGLPNVRATAAETETSQGAGLARAKGEKGAAIAQFGGQLAHAGSTLGAIGADMVAQQTRAADETALLEAANTIDRAENDLLYGETGAYKVKGKDAMPLPESVGGRYQEIVGEVAAGLSTDRQRRAFAKLSMQRATRLDLGLRRHVFGEMQAYEAGELNKHVENQVSRAIQNASDPSAVSEALGDAIASIKASGPRLGLGPNGLEAAVNDVTTRTHVGVIESLIDQKQAGKARAYFAQAKDEINGQALRGIEDKLNAGTVKQEAAKQADAIVAAGGTLKEQRDKAKAITDVDVRDNVMARLEHEDAVNDRATREAEAARLSSAYNIVDKTGSVDRIPISDQVALATHMPQLRAFALARAKGVPVETDLATYYDLMKRAGNKPADFAKENLLAYRGKLGETEFKQLAGLQLSIKNSDTKAADAQLSGFRTRQDILAGSLTNYGIETRESQQTPAEKNAVAQLSRMVDLRVEQLQDSTGKKATNVDIQTVIDGLLSTPVETTGSWWDAWPGGKPGPFTKTTKPLIGMTFDDVPTTERDKIGEALKAKGKPVSDAMILNVYIEHQARQPRK